MVTRSPALIQRLVQVAATAAAAGHGRKEAVYAAACAELGMSRPTLMRALSDVAVRGDRKRRVDAGQVSLTREDAILISAMLMESLRKNGKRILSVAQAVDILRRNNEVKAEFLDPASSEVRQLSASAIARGLRTHGMHPDQLLRPAPAVEMQSLHPNHVWQIDASLCVLYYLKAGSDRESGLQVMRSSVFYKNKPANLKRIENDRVWRYVVTDHYSGAVWVHYVFGAESALNISESFIAAIQPSGDERRPVHGVPRIVMMDMGSANTSAVFLNLLKRLQVEPIAHAPENARATGQVEKAQDLVERSFESGLRFQPVATLDELNAQAAVWMTWFNGTQRHTRHGHTRYAMWATIRDEQLRLAPSVEMCRLLLTHQPESRKVNDRLRVEFGGQGREWDVSGIPRVMVGEKVMVTWNPYRDDEVYVVDADADGHEVLHPARLVERNAAGFAVTANVIGEDYKRPADTVADQHRKEVERAAMDAATLEEAEAKRKAKALPFGGRIDPHRGLEEQTASTAYIPRQGTALETTARISAAPERVLARFELARALVDLGVEMTPERNAQVAAWYPDGVPESQLEDLKRRLTTRATLRVVGGGN